MQETDKQFSPRILLAGILILSALPLLIVEMFPGQLKFVMEPPSYIIFHNIAEFFSIMVSLSMFGVSWFTYEQSKNRHALFLGTAFLAIGIMDFMHTMSMPAMPDFISPNDAQKSVQFWIPVRLFQAVAFLASAYVYPDKPIRWLSKRVLILSSLLVSSLVFIGIIFFQTHMPTFFVFGVGVTPLKKFCEYLIIFLLCAATLAYWRRMERTGDRLLIYYLAAFMVSIFSELPLAFYARAFDTYNVLGHINKVIAFFLIYYGVYRASVKDPYIKLADIGERLREDVAQREIAEQALRQSEERYRTLLQNIQAAVIVHGPQTEILTSNSLAQKLLGLTKDQMLGKTAIDPAWHFSREDGTVMPLAEYPVNQVLARRQPLRDFIVGVHRPDAGDVWVLVNADPVFDDKDGITQVIVTFVDLTERKRTEEELRETGAALLEREKLLRDLSDRLLNAHEEERKKIAGELHDTIGACLAGIKFKVEDILQRTGKTSKDTAESLITLIPVIQEAVEECRRIQMDLRPPMLDELGLLPTLSWFCRRFETIYSGIKVELGKTLLEEGEIPDSLKTVIFRVVQEAMNNIAKHSKADFVRLTLQKNDEGLELMLQDNGRGFDLEKVLGQESTRRGLGLTSMRERIEFSGGIFDIRSTEGKGTTIRACWPLNENEP